ncbi:Uncharacterised protein [Mycobacteroides abscessus subsp. abscessus]|nr:Uncharacterised protein [Mycobacteroides abscessus subsp. abscessus]
MEVDDHGVIDPKDRRVERGVVGADVQPRGAGVRGEQFHGRAAAGDDGLADPFLLAAQDRGGGVGVPDEKPHRHTAGGGGEQGVEESVEGVEQERGRQDEDVDAGGGVGEMLLPHGDG